MKNLVNTLDATVSVQFSRKLVWKVAVMISRSSSKGSKLGHTKYGKPLLTLGDTVQVKYP
jgi:hypothetical protein